jgi:hypothetical protein
VQAETPQAQEAQVVRVLFIFVAKLAQYKT